MYVGKRDAHLTIKVPMELCFETKFSGATWIEVLVPQDTDPKMDPWMSFVVKPQQVFWLTRGYNVIEEINKDTKIRCIKHYTDEFGNRRHIPETEVMLDPYDIMKAMDTFEEKKVRERYGIKR